MAAPTVDSHSLHRQLLRPPVLDILRATGFTRARPTVLDTIIDLTSRYLTLLAVHTAQHAQARPVADGETQITITDIRRALRDVGGLHPQLSELEESARGEEDLRGVEAFLEWARGDVNREIRRIAGISRAASLSASGAAADSSAAIITATTDAGSAGVLVGRRPSPAVTAAAANAANAAAAVEAQVLVATEAKEDFLTLLKKKHSQTGEESRWQGTVLGKDHGERDVVIEGWEVSDIRGWGRRLEQLGVGKIDEEVLEEAESPNSSPLSEMTGSGLDSGFG